MTAAASNGSSHFTCADLTCAYTARVPRWLAIALGGLTALGMQVVFELLAEASPLPNSPAVHYAAIVLALVLGGYVAGSLVGSYHAFSGALAAVLYVFVTVTVSAVREVPQARQLGLAALPPIDLLQLTLTDVLAMTAATWGGWLAGRG
jgi:hypothetical protein